MLDASEREVLDAMKEFKQVYGVYAPVELDKLEAIIIKLRKEKGSK